MASPLRHTAPMMPHRAQSPYDWQALQTLITQAFAGMAGRINPPSSAGNLTPQTLAQLSQTSEIWVIGQPPQACMILTPMPDKLYLGKLAVLPDQRGRGLARRLVTHAETRARALQLSRLELETRIELTENHAFFQHLGFTELARTAHAGFDRPTAITFAKPV